MQTGNDMAGAHGIRVGMGGWDLPPFDGLFYPAGVRKGFRKLEYYSRFFDFVELNASFYNTSFTPAQVRQWLRDVEQNPAFIFSVKLYKGFTHDGSATSLDALRIARLLDDLTSNGRCAGLLLQFPYSFTNNQANRAHLLTVSKLFRAYPQHVEVRHNSWNVPAIVRMFREHGICPVNVDLPAIRRHMPFTSLTGNGRAYVRLMGRNRDTWEQPWRMEESGTHLVSDRYLYYYSSMELKSIARAIVKAAGRVSSTYVVFHNDPRAQSLVNGFQIRKLLKPDAVVVSPPSMLYRFPELQEVAIPDSGTQLPLLET